ncbi:ATP-binding protein [Petroclostridium sp. X23]|uniref:ATP-binding protein n=1 Tax=Petroclostridium sp. X23 TaxID=3045146 RepID=UPI0024ADEE04|nr:ATP-binding protein [Petroclostridium sp. X23]WHH56862.1 ATP-binding protein [Petroclostridium sp. X23]
MKNDCSCSVTISADTQYIVGAVEEIMIFLQTHMYLSDGAFFETKVILNELLVNAVVHGNKQDSEKKVYIKAGVCKENKIYIIVEDEGDGLIKSAKSCGKEILDYDAEVELFCLNESGRGLIITSSLCDCFKRNKKGNKIVVVKKIKQ